jgi:2-keto-4-pentenoate hydratase
MTDLQTVADALLQARRQRTTRDASAFAHLLKSPADAYAVQQRVAQGLHEAAPRVWKSGGPSRSATLTHAGLPAAGVLRSPADARGLHFNFRWIEAEIALRIGADRTPDAMCVSIEIVDSRWTENLEAPPLAKLADLQSHGALVLGAWLPYDAREWARQRCEVTIAGQVHAFTGTHSLADPAWLVPAWLAHAQGHGLDSAEGAVVTTGTWCGMLPARAGDLVQVRFPGIGEAQVQL